MKEWIKLSWQILIRLATFGYMVAALIAVCRGHSDGWVQYSITALLCDYLGRV